ncbi:MAG: polyphosphate polymerase domain-containing protein [Bacteroidetes bacterium]|nr:polyphosphate polymerase domain-containing protein [Bacteroidota bacterium]
MDRREEKFLIPNTWCAPLAKSLDKDYKILEINGNRQFEYRNLYFDTPENNFLDDHIRERKNKYKVRIRSYVNSNICFLEIKEKNVHGRSVKMRVQRTSEKWDAPLTDSEKRFLSERIPFASELSPVLYISYSRFTLAHLNKGERITFDTDLTFTSIQGKISKPLQGLLVIELKQAETDRRSPLFVFLRSLPERTAQVGRIIKISKYVLGRLSSDDSLSPRTYLSKLKVLKRAANAIT